VRGDRCAGGLAGVVRAAVPELPLRRVWEAERIMKVRRDDVEVEIHGVVEGEPDLRVVEVERDKAVVLLAVRTPGGVFGYRVVMTPGSEAIATVARGEVRVILRRDLPSSA